MPAGGPLARGASGSSGGWARALAAAPRLPAAASGRFRRPGRAPSL